MYSKDDLEEIMGELLNQIKETVKRDLETATSMSALVLEQVLAAADDSGVSIAVDMSKTEDAGVYFVAQGGETEAGAAANECSRISHRRSGGTPSAMQDLFRACESWRPASAPSGTLT